VCRPVWVSEACQFFRVPSRSSNTPLYASKCCELGSMLRLLPLLLCSTWTHIWVLHGVGSASEGQFHFLALWHTTNSEEAYGITWPCGPHHFKLVVSRIFNTGIWRRLEWHKIWSFHGHGLIDHLGSIHFSYAWLCNWEHPFLTWPKGKSPGALHANQTLPWRTTPTQCGTMWFLCALIV